MKRKELYPWPTPQFPERALEPGARGERTLKDVHLILTAFEQHCEELTRDAEEHNDWNSEVGVNAMRNTGDVINEIRAHIIQRFRVYPDVR